MDFQLDYQNYKPLLITLAGLPGTGKTTLAKAVAKKLSLVYLRLDCIEVPFYRYNATSGSKGEGYILSPSPHPWIRNSLKILWN